MGRGGGADTRDTNVLCNTSFHRSRGSAGRGKGGGPDCDTCEPAPERRCRSRSCSQKRAFRTGIGNLAPSRGCRRRAGRSRSVPPQPRRPDRAAPEAPPGPGAGAPNAGLLWPSSSSADSPYRPSPPGGFLPPGPPPPVHTAPPPAASRSPCPGAAPRGCGMGWVGCSAASPPGHLTSELPTTAASQVPPLRSYRSGDASARRGRRRAFDFGEAAQALPLPAIRCRSLTALRSIAVLSPPGAPLILQFAPTALIYSGRERGGRRSE